MEDGNSMLATPRHEFVEVLLRSAFDLTLNNAVSVSLYVNLQENAKGIAIHGERLAPSDY